MRSMKYYKNNNNYYHYDNVTYPHNSTNDYDEAAQWSHTEIIVLIVHMDKSESTLNVNKWLMCHQQQ